MPTVTSQSMPGADRLLGDPEWLPHAIDLAQGTISFVHALREAHRQVTFLDDEYLKTLAGAERRTLRLDAVRQNPPVVGETHFIFHSAFCCSTLLARAFDLPGVAMGLKEPAILNQLAALARGGAMPRELVELVSGLLARPFAPGEAVIVKPSNVANLLIEPILAARPSTRALLMYSPLPAFLRSVAKRGMWGRIWGRRLYALLRRERTDSFGFSPEETFEQTDLQIAALAWLMHHGQFAEVVRRMPDRVRVLSSEELLADRHRTLAAAAELFGIDLPAARIDEIVAGPAFTEHSKEIGRRFDAAERQTERAAASAHEEEIAMVARWAEAVATHAGIPMSLGNALLAPA